MTTLFTVPQAQDYIRQQVEERQDTMFRQVETRPVPDGVIRSLTDVLANAFLADIFTPFPNEGAPQKRANLVRINARFNVRQTGEVTRAYLDRQLDRFEGWQTSGS